MLLILAFRILPKMLVVCVLCCTMVVACAARTPGSEAAWTRFGFEACALPCYAGMTPGETPFRETGTLLINHVPALDPRVISSGTSLNFFARMTGQQLAGLVRYQSGGQVGEIRLNSVLPLDQVLMQLGAPDCILATTVDRAPIIFWERGMVSVAAVLGMDNSAYQPGANIFSLWLRVATPPDCTLRGARSWQGFAPLWVYQAKS
jgi:hypothetical protein